MSARARSTALAAVLVVGASSLTAISALPAAAKAPPDWTAPTAIPGTDDLFNPQGATAPNGADLVIWVVGSGVGFENEVHAKVRLPGREQWRTMPVQLHGTFLGVTDIEPTPSGDFWIAYGTGSTDAKSFVVRLDSRGRHWSKPVKLFTDQKTTWHASPEVELAADGTLVAAALSQRKVDPPTGNPKARISVGVHKPGGTWQNRFVSPANRFSSRQHLAVNESGDIVVSFVQGYDLADLTVRAATKGHAKSAGWKVATLSDAGDSQEVSSAIGRDGTAVVIWSATSQTFDAVRMSTRQVRRPLDPWTGRDLVTASTFTGVPRAVVDPRGNVTAVWRRASGSTGELWSRYLQGSTLDPAVQLTPGGELAEFDGLTLQPNGRAGVLYQRFTTGPLTSLGVEFRTLKAGVPSPVVPVLGNEATDGAANNEALSVDAASQSTLIYSRGTSPDADFAWLTNADARPAVVTGPSSGKPVRRAQVVGHPEVGKTVACATGYWVEASALSYQWTRNGHSIPGADAKRYRIAGGDSGRRLACVVTADNSSGQQVVLTSPGRRVS